MSAQNQCSSCGGGCGKRCQRQNIDETGNWFKDHLKSVQSSRARTMEQIRYNLFKYMVEEHGVTLLENEISEILTICSDLKKI